MCSSPVRIEGPNVPVATVRGINSVGLGLVKPNLRGGTTGSMGIALPRTQAILGLAALLILAGCSASPAAAVSQQKPQPGTESTNDLKGQVAKALNISVASLMSSASERAPVPEKDFDALERKLGRTPVGRIRYYSFVLDAARAGRRDIVDRAIECAEQLPADLPPNAHFILVQKLAASAAVLEDPSMMDRVIRQGDRLFYGKYWRQMGICNVGVAMAALYGKQGQPQQVERYVQRYAEDLRSGSTTYDYANNVWGSFGQWAAFAGNTEAAQQSLEKVRDPRYRLLIVAQILETSIRSGDHQNSERVTRLLEREHKGGATRTRQYYQSLGLRNGGEASSEFNGKFTEAVAGRLAMALAGLPRLEPYKGLP